jgi:hypothetical protein
MHLLVNGELLFRVIPKEVSGETPKHRDIFTLCLRASPVNFYNF